MIKKNFLFRGAFIKFIKNYKVFTKEKTKQNKNFKKNRGGA